MPDHTSCCRVPGGYCQRCDLLVGLDGLHVIGVERDDDGSLRVQVESRRPEVMGCPACGVVAHAHGRQQVELIDAPCFIARQLGCSWKTLWRAVKPILEAAAAEEDRFGGVTTLGVDEHIWHHVSTKPVGLGGRGPKEFTGMVRDGDR